MKKILFTSLIFLSIIIPLVIKAENSQTSYSPWLILGTIIQPKANSWTLKIPSTNGGCLVTDASGVVSTTTCGSGGTSSNYWSDSGTYLSPATSTRGVSSNIFKNGATYSISSSTDLATFIAGVPSGSTILLDAGIYNVSSTLAIDKSINLIGKGVDQTSIQKSNSFTGNVINISQSYSSLNNLTIIGGLEGTDVDIEPGLGDTDILANISMSNVNLIQQSVIDSDLLSLYSKNSDLALNNVFIKTFNSTMGTSNCMKLETSDHTGGGTNLFFENVILQCAGGNSGISLEAVDSEVTGTDGLNLTIKNSIFAGFNSITNSLDKSIYVHGNNLVSVSAFNSALEGDVVQEDGATVGVIATNVLGNYYINDQNPTLYNYNGDFLGQLFVNTTNNTGKLNIGSNTTNGDGINLNLSGGSATGINTTISGGSATGNLISGIAGGQIGQSIQMTAPNGSGTTYGLLVNNTTPNYYAIYSQNGLNLFNGTSTFMSNVGIGTTSPDKLLTLSEKNDSDGLKIYGYDDRSANYLTLDVDSAGQPRLTSSGTTRFYVNATQVLLYTNTQVQVPGTIGLFVGGNMGVGSSTPTAKLTVQGVAGQTNPLFVVASSSNSSVFSIGKNGHTLTGGIAPTLSSCGTNPSLQGDDNTMRIIIGSGVGVTSCLVTFANPWVNLNGTNISPVCVAEDESNVPTVDIAASSTPTTTLISTTGAGFAGRTMDVICRGSNNFVN